MTIADIQPSVFIDGQTHDTVGHHRGIVVVQNGLTAIFPNVDDAIVHRANPDVPLVVGNHTFHQSLCVVWLDIIKMYPSELITFKPGQTFAIGSQPYSPFRGDGHRGYDVRRSAPVFHIIICDVPSC